MSFHGCIRETFFFFFFNSQQTMAVFGYQKYIDILFLYMSLNVNLLSPDKWFCNIYEVCVLG